MPMLVLRVIVGVRVVVPSVVVLSMVMPSVVVPILGGRHHRIGATLRIERRLDRHHRGTELTQHVLDHVIAAQTERPAHDLRRQVPIADVPGQPHEVAVRPAPHLDQRLGRRHDLDQATVLERQGVAAAQSHGLGQIEQELEPAHTGHDDATAVPVVEVEHHAVRGVLRHASPRARTVVARITSTSSGLVVEVRLLGQEAVVERLLDREGGLFGEQREVDPGLGGRLETT